MKFSSFFFDTEVGKAYGISTDLHSRMGYESLSFRTHGARKEDLPTLVDASLTELARFLAQGISPDAFNLLREDFIVGEKILDSPYNPSLLHDFPMNFLLSKEEVIEIMKSITLSEFMEAARLFIRLDNASLILEQPGEVPGSLIGDRYPWGRNIIESKKS